MGVLAVGLLQMVSHGVDQDANLRKGDAFCRRAAELGADIALFPEMWNIGYARWNVDEPGAKEAWQARAARPEDPFVLHFTELASELRMAIALTYLERWPGAPRNTVSLIDRTGNIALTYAKVHTCDFDMEAACTPGDDFPVCDLDTAAGPVKVGAMICFDREFPESARMLMLNGAELILTPNACNLGPIRLGQYQARAYENMVGLAMANYAAPQLNGRSCAFDGVVFEEVDGAERDTCLVQAGAEEGVYLARFDMDRIRAYRARESWGDAYRKPRAYARLTDPTVRPPFVRPDARR